MRNLLAVLCITALILVACTQKTDVESQMRAAAADAQKQALQQQSTGQLTRLYDYSNVKEYTYKSIGYDGRRELLSYFANTVESDSMSGKDAWHVKTVLTLENVTFPNGTSSYTEIWFDKAAEKCLKADAVVISAGQSSTSPNPCGPTMVVGNSENGYYPYIGEETITVPAGTFSTKKYGLPGAVVYYIADGVPVPVKQTWGKGTPEPGTTYFELMSYS